MEQIDEELNPTGLAQTKKHNENTTPRQSPQSTENPTLRRVSRKYVRCLSEYYNDYEEVLEEYRLYQKTQTPNPADEQNFDIKQDPISSQPNDNIIENYKTFIVGDDDTTIVASRDFSTDDFSESVFLTRWASAPDILLFKSEISCDTDEQLSVPSAGKRRKSMVPGMGESLQR